MNVLSTSSAKATQSAGQDFAALINSRILPLTIWLIGEIGSGKTTFAQGLISGMGWSGRVKSPTYSLVESYDTPQAPIFHFDLYRIKDANELENIGIRDYFSQTVLILIEWADLMCEVLPSPDMLLHFAYPAHPTNNMSSRDIAFIGKSAVGQKLITQIKW